MSTQQLKHSSQECTRSLKRHVLHQQHQQQETAAAASDLQNISNMQKFTSSAGALLLPPLQLPLRRAFRPPTRINSRLHEGVFPAAGLSLQEGASFSNNYLASSDSMSLIAFIDAQRNIISDAAQISGQIGSTDFGSSNILCPDLPFTTKPSTASLGVDYGYTTQINAIRLGATLVARDSNMQYVWQALSMTGHNDQQQTGRGSCHQQAEIAYPSLRLWPSSSTQPSLLHHTSSLTEQDQDELMSRLQPGTSGAPPGTHYLKNGFIHKVAASSPVLTRDVRHLTDCTMLPYHGSRRYQSLRASEVGPPLAALVSSLDPRASSVSSRSSNILQGPTSFPMILHRALTQLEFFDGGTEIASFTLDGRSFHIKNQFLLEKRVLPVFFPRMKGFASFQRQLNLYDFKRIREARVDRGAYQHDLFVRELPALAQKIKRTKIKRLRGFESKKAEEHQNRS